jgi:hypothetical protein
MDDVGDGQKLSELEGGLTHVDLLGAIEFVEENYDPGDRSQGRGTIEILRVLETSAQAMGAA